MCARAIRTLWCILLANPKFTEIKHLPLINYVTFVFAWRPNVFCSKFEKHHIWDFDIKWFFFVHWRSLASQFSRGCSGVGQRNFHAAAEFGIRIRQLMRRWIPPENVSNGLRCQLNTSARTHGGARQTWRTQQIRSSLFPASISARSKSIHSNIFVKHTRSFARVNAVIYPSTWITV